MTRAGILGWATGGIGMRVIAYGVLALVLGLVAALTVAKLDASSARKDLTIAQAARDDAIRKNGALELRLQEQSAAIAQQNTAVDGMAKAGERGSQAAGRAASDVLRQGQKRRRDIKASKGVGPGELNAWIQEATQE